MLSLSSHSSGQRQQGQTSSTGESVSGNGGDGTWQQNFNQHQSLHYSSPSNSVSMDYSLDVRYLIFSEVSGTLTVLIQYGGNMEGNEYYPPMGNPNAEFDFNQLFGGELDSLDIDFDANHPYGVPSININRSNTIPPQSTQDWQPPSSVHLSPIRTDMSGNLSPAFSTPSQTSDSSYGFLSPHQTGPLTPSPVSPREQSYVGIQSPEFATQRLESQSPATGTLGLEVRSLSLFENLLWD
jgi:hypothetical protein